MYIFTTKNLEYIRSSVRQLRYFKLHKTIVSSLKTSLFYALLQISIFDTDVFKNDCCGCTIYTVVLVLLLITISSKNHTCTGTGLKLNFTSCVC
jgi:hypothetical protein